MFKREVKVRDPLGNEAVTRYDAAVASAKKDAEGFVTRLTYDAANRLVLEEDFEPTSAARKHIQVIAWDDEALTETLTDRWSVTDPSGVATSYSNDGLDRLKTVTTPAEASVYRWWPDSLFKGIDFANGLKERRCYDAAGGLTAQVTGRTVDEQCPTTATRLANWNVYAYDANGNRKRQLEQRTDAATQGLKPEERTEYAYDGLDRLVGVRYADGRIEAYRLDEVGNRTGERATQRGPVQTNTAIPGRH